MLTLASLLLAAAYGTVGDIEVILTLIAAIGLVFSIFNIRQAWGDWNTIKATRRKVALLKIAWLRLRSEVGRALIQAWFVALGIFAMFIAEPSPLIHQPLKLVIFGVLFRYGIILASIILTLKSYWGYETREEVLEEDEDAS